MITRREVVVAAFSVALLGAVCGSDPSLTESGAARPEVAVSFPNELAPGTVATAVVKVRNPGPEPITSVVVAFSLVGSAGGTIPEPLIEVGVRKRSPSIVDVRPKPRAVSSDAVVYRFGGPTGKAELPQGGEMTIEFDIRAPREPGRAASSVLVYAGEDPERARGALLQTEVLG